MTSIPNAVRDDILGSGIVTRIFQHETVDSTMHEAKRMIKKQPRIAENALIIAEKQEFGHGRFQRKWFSPEGGLYFSLILQNKLDPSFTLVAGLAVAEAIEDFFGREVQLAWPNDVLIGGKKIAGVLCETYGNFTIVGVGVNTFEPSLIDPSIQNRARAIPLLPKLRCRLLVNIIMRLASMYRIFRSEGFAPLKNSYEKRLSMIGESVELSSGIENYHGIFCGVNDRGAIIIDSGSEKKTIFSAEITAHDSKTKEII